MVIPRRSLLLAGVALPAVARAQCVTGAFAVDACLGGARITVAVEAPALDLSFMTPGSLDGRITFTRASTATYFDNTGTLQTAAINAPRWDYNPITRQLNGLFIEEQRINLLLNSATLGTQSVTVTAVATTLSFYGTGTVTLSGTATGTLVGAGASPARATLTFTPTAGTLTLTVTGSVLNAQLEAGPMVTSYIPTTAAAVTRSADAATMPTSPWYTNALAVSAAVDAMVPVAGINASSFEFDDGTNPNRFSFTFNASGTVVQCFEVLGNVTTMNASVTGVVTAGVSYKGGISLTSGYHFMAANGVIQAVINTNSASPPLVTTLRLGKLLAATSGAGYLRRFRYWPRALSSVELQVMTT